MAGKTVQTEVDGRVLKLTNLDKVLYPQAGFTKGQVIDYYVRIAPVLLPHLEDRPLTMKRYPDGVEGEFFYEKQCPSYRPDWVETAPVESERSSKRKVINYCLANDLPTLVWAANLADLELHTLLSKKQDVQRPTMLVFDLDPGAPAGIIECCQVALWVRDLLAESGLDVYIKTSGSKGMQAYVPLNGKITYDQTKPFARAVAERLERDHPDQVISKMHKELRKGKVFVDWSQNDDHKTTVCVYSLRANERPTVSTPLHWQEVEQALAQGDRAMLSFLPKDVLARVEQEGDLFEPLLRQKQRLPKITAVERVEAQVD